MSQRGRVTDGTRTGHGRDKPRESRGLDGRTGKPSTYGYGKGEERIVGWSGKQPVRASTRPSSIHKPSDNRTLGRGRAELRPVRAEADPSARILDLARQVERLTVTRRDPHRFFEDRSEIAEELRSLARTLPPAKTRAEP